MALDLQDESQQCCATRGTSTELYANNQQRDTLEPDHDPHTRVQGFHIFGRR